MKTRPYLLVAICLLISEISSFAQSVPPISGWDLDEKGGSYTLKPKVPGDIKEFIYEIMPVVKIDGQSVDEWFGSAIDKNIKEEGFTLPASSSKRNIFTNQTIFSYSSELTDKKGKAWYVTYIGYQVGNGENRMARVMSSPDVKYYSTYMRPVAEHIGQLEKIDASAAAAGRLTRSTAAHTRQEVKTTPVAVQSEPIPEKGLKSQEINGILIHLEYNTTSDGKMARIYKPYLVLNDGSIYSEPVISPYSLDIAQSKLKEPNKWGTWKLKNNSFMVEWTARNETEKWFKNWFWATPSQKEEKLEGSFITVNGIENDGLKSYDKAITSKYIAFNNSGQFTITGSDNNSNAALPASEFNKKNEAGTYTLNDYSIELHFNNGNVIRRIFYFYLQGKTHFGVGNAVYSPKQFAEASTTSN